MPTLFRMQRYGDIRLAERGNLDLPLRHIPSITPDSVQGLEKAQTPPVRHEKSPRTAQWLPAGINHLFMSGKRDSNPRPSAWEADALPTELLPRSECKYTKSAELSSSFGQFLFSPSDIDDKRTGASVPYRKTGPHGYGLPEKRPSTACGRPFPSDTLSGYPQQPDTVRETECKTGVSPTPVHCSAVGRSLRKTHGDTTVYGPLRCGRIGRHRRELFSEALGTDTVCPESRPSRVSI